MAQLACNILSGCRTMLSVAVNVEPSVARMNHSSNAAR